MKLTPEQRRGIEERFAVLREYIRGNLDGLLVSDEDIPNWRERIEKDIEACREEVITLVERIEPEPVREGEDR